MLSSNWLVLNNLNSSDQKVSLWIYVHRFLRFLSQRSAEWFLSGKLFRKVRPCDRRTIRKTLWPVSPRPKLVSGDLKPQPQPQPFVGRQHDITYMCDFAEDKLIPQRESEALATSCCVPDLRRTPHTYVALLIPHLHSSRQRTCSEPVCTENTPNAISTPWDCVKTAEPGWKVLLSFLEACPYSRTRALLQVCEK